MMFSSPVATPPRGRPVNFKGDLDEFHEFRTELIAEQSNNHGFQWCLAPRRGPPPPSRGNPANFKEAFDEFHEF